MSGASLIAELDLEARARSAARRRARDHRRALRRAGRARPDRRELERFITRGIDAETHRAIGDLPRGRGILGLLIEEPQPLRLAHIGDHPQSYGFPPGHPPMADVPRRAGGVRDEVWGNLYLTEKEGGERVHAADEESVVILAAWAAIAIENARLYEAVAARRDHLERAVRGLETTRGDRRRRSVARPSSTASSS